MPPLPPYRQTAPERDRSAEERELDEMLAAAQARGRRKRRVLIAAFVGVVLLALAPIGWQVVNYYRETRASEEQLARYMRERRVDPSGRAHAEAEVAKAREALKTRAASFRAATTDAALAGLAPGLHPCPIHLEPPRLRAGSYAGNSGGGTADYARHWFVHHLGTEGFEPSIGEALTVDDFANALAAGTAEKTKLHEIEDIVQGKDHPVLFRADYEDKPLALGGGIAAEYAGGKVSGRAFLYDETTETVLCAANATAENSEKVNIEYTSYGVLDTTSRNRALREELERDLDIHLEIAIAGRMKRAVPADSPEAKDEAEAESAAEPPPDGTSDSAP